LEEQQNLYVKDNKITDLYVYFNRPSEIQLQLGQSLPSDHNGKNMDQLLYTEFMRLYCWDKKLKPTYVKQPHNEGFTWWKINLPNRKTVFITKRLDPEKCIARMNMVYASAGEIYYLRLLLLHLPARSFKELINMTTTTRNAVRTYQEACFHHGFLSDYKEANRCFEEAMVFSTPGELRNLFVIQTIQGFPTEAIYNDATKRIAMSKDFIIRIGQGNNSPMAMNELLADLAERFQAENRFEYLFDLNNIILYYLMLFLLRTEA
jgi:hypothetical protein